MKKTLIVALSIFTFINSKAQIEKGSNALSINAGAGFGLSSTKDQSSNIFQINVQPVFEHFVATNLSLGAAINGGFQFENYENKYSVSPYKSSYYIQTYSLSIQLKKYWFASPKIGFTLSPQLANTYYELNSRTDNSFSNTYYTYSYNYWYNSAMLNFGVVYFIKPNVAIEAQTNFLNYSYYPERSNNQHVFTALAFQSSLMVGVKFILGKQKENLTP